MKTWMLLMAVCLLITVTTGASSEDEVPTVKVVPLEPDDAWRFSLLLGHRMYPDWSETVAVALGEKFFLADTEFLGEVSMFYPDFKIIDGKRVNTSLEMTNPAVRLFVHEGEGEAVADTAWAFLNFPPHFKADAFFTFQLLGIEGYVAPSQEHSNPREETTP